MSLPSSASPTLLERLFLRPGVGRLLRRLPGPPPRPPHRTRSVVRLVVDGPGDVARHNVEVVSRLCARLDIPCFEVPSDGPRHRVGVPAENWDRLLEALRADRAPARYAASPGRDLLGRAVLRPGTAQTVLADPSRVRIVAVGDWVAAGGSGEVHGPELACEVERWDALPDGSHVAPQPNRLTTRTTLALLEPAAATPCGSRLAGAGQPSPFEVRFPIDLVLTWVDGSDPQWLRRRRAALDRSTHRPRDVADSPSRYRDNGELRYALRSIHRNLPWVRTTYLVTDDQVPEWLDTSHPGLRVVSHRELFAGTGVEHSFNSHAISARLHHLPGLSDHFLYTNDDIFVGRPLAPSAFFLGNGLARLAVSRSTLPIVADRPTVPHEAARENSAELVHRRFGVRPRQNFMHVPLPMRRSVLVELEQHHSEALAATWGHPFRSVDDVEIGWLHHYTAFATGRATVGGPVYDYFAASSEAAWEGLRRLAIRRHLDVFCINDDDEADAQHSRRIAPWLARYFPSPSPYERGAAGSGRSCGQGSGK